MNKCSEVNVEKEPTYEKDHCRTPLVEIAYQSG